MPSRHGAIRERASEPVAAAVVRSLVRSIGLLFRSVAANTISGTNGNVSHRDDDDCVRSFEGELFASFQVRSSTCFLSPTDLIWLCRDKSSDSKVLFLPSSFWIRSVGGGGRSTHHTEAVIYFVLHPHEYKCVVTSSWPVALPACRVPNMFGQQRTVPSPIIHH